MAFIKPVEPRNNPWLWGMFFFPFLKNSHLKYSTANHGFCCATLFVFNGTKIPEKPMVFSGHTFSIGWLKTIKRVSIIFDYGKIYRRLFPLQLGSTSPSQRDYALGIPKARNSKSFLHISVGSLGVWGVCSMGYIWKFLRAPKTTMEPPKNSWFVLMFIIKFILFLLGALSGSICWFSGVGGLLCSSLY